MPSPSDILAVSCRLRFMSRLESSGFPGFGFAVHCWTRASLVDFFALHEWTNFRGRPSSAAMVGSLIFRASAGPAVDGIRTVEISCARRT